MTDDEKTCYAEGSYAAKTGGYLHDNPYPPNHEFGGAWVEGFIKQLYNIRTELRVTHRSYVKVLDQIGILRGQMNQLQAEYTAFRQEMGY
jgi:hypothetical protein